jgi:PAS domain S-box-containing protein
MEERKNMVQQLFEQAQVFAVAIDRFEVVLDVSTKGCEILGLSREEIVGKNWFSSFVPKEERENTRRRFHEMLRESLRHVHNEYPIVAQQGVVRIFNWHNVLSSDEEGNIIGILSSGDDVTERRLIDKTSAAIENRLQVSLDSVIEGYQIIDSDWRYAYLNEAAARQGRRTREELLGKTMMEVYPGIEQTTLFSHLRSCMTNRVSHSMENEFTFPDGSKGWFELRIEPVPEGVLILSLDITENKENEAELNRYRQRLEEVVSTRTAECLDAKERLMTEVNAHRMMEDGLKLRVAILDNSREAIFLINTSGDFAYANKAAVEMYGYSVEDFLKLNLRDLVRPEEAFGIENRLKTTVEHGKLELDTVHLRKDGTVVAVNVRHSLIRTEHGQFIVSSVREVTTTS